MKIGKLNTGILALIVLMVIAMVFISCDNDGIGGADIDTSYESESIWDGLAETETESDMPTEKVTENVTENITEASSETERETGEECRHEYSNACDDTCNICGEIRETNGHVRTVLVGKNPTCESDGVTEGAICLVCGETLEEQTVIPALGHDEVEVDGIGVTCTEDGYEAYVYCTRCTYTTKKTISALGHDKESHEGRDATCTEAGWRPYETCTRCDYSTYIKIGAKGHDKITHNSKEATCTENGYKAYVTCSRCNYNTYEETEKLGHSWSNVYNHDEEYHWKTCTRCNEITQKAKHDYKDNSICGCGYGCEHANLSEWKTTIEASCTQTGVEIRTCLSCGVVAEQRQINKKDHTPGAEATCTDDQICTVCGEVIEFSKGHVPEFVAGKAQTCTRWGLSDGEKCSVCGVWLSECQQIPPNGHTPQTVHGKSATCTESGLTDGEVCMECEKVLKEQEVIDPIGHTPETIKGILPTCTESGITDGEICSVCKKILKEQEEIKPTGHDERVVKGKDATCTESGLTDGVYCDVCKSWITKQSDIDALGHDYSDNNYGYDEKVHWLICKRCKQKSDTEAHTFTSSGVCKTCLAKKQTTEIKVYHMVKGKGEYNAKDFAFDYLFINGEVIAGAGTQTPVLSVDKITLGKDDEVKLQGWVGFTSHKISAYGYYFNNDIENATISGKYIKDTEEAVLNAGGANALRFQIPVSVGDLSVNKKISFVVVLDDGTYVIMDYFTLVTSGVTVDISDDEIVKADKDRLENIDMKVEYKDGKYFTDSGLSYKASGDGTAVSNGKFIIPKSSSLKINFDDGYEKFNTEFNKYKLSYYSSQPLKAIVTYVQGSDTILDVVYLEEGSELFLCLIDGYLKGLSAKNISSIEIISLGDDDKFTFVLYDVTVENVDIISSGLTYIENSRFKLGIKLSWGGGISYLADKQDGDSTITNLINCADTGRLVQQSYYGTNLPPYECGDYNGTTWGYNPVQGGNLHNQASRIIDVKINERSVYVKAQPRDWAKTNLAECYMENVYTLYFDRVQVDNRFVDFTGYQNSARHQELPAFYTIGYLNTFVYYNGNRPWTGASLNYEKSLSFWSGNTSQYFGMQEGNTETWCAWINYNANYGLGLYVPNTEILYAGRHAYDAEPDSKNPSSGTCNYVAPLNTLRMVSFEPFEYSYLITGGSVEQIRETFTKYKDFTDNSDLKDSKFR